MKQMDEERHRLEKEISQLEHRQTILLNKKANAERRERTHRLIERGAILESVFLSVASMTGEEVKAFLLDISRLPEVRERQSEAPRAEAGGIHERS